MTRELTPAQWSILEKLLGGGFIPVAFAMYPGVIGMRRGAFAALLEPVGETMLRVVGHTFYLIDGYPSVLLKLDDGTWFGWKSRRVRATAEMIVEMKQFTADLAALLELGK
jgi:hypothetical protein